MFNHWITNGTDRPFYARKSFHLSCALAKATARVCGLGQFNLYINGQKVSDHVLDPAWSDYRKRVYYVTYDITPYLAMGENEVLAEVGNGWYVADWDYGYSFHFPPFMPPNPNPYQPFNTELIFAFEADLELADGGRVTWEADQSWQVAEHPVRRTNSFGSEIIDGSKKDPDAWAPAKIAQNSPSPDLLSEQTLPPIRVIEVREGRFLHTANGRSIYDFGLNGSGLLKVTLKGKAGVPIHLYPAEKLDEAGDADQMAKGWMPIDVCETYIPAKDDVWEEFAMTFTYMAGRYIAIDTAPENVQDVRVEVITSAWKEAGTFHCDDERYNQIYDMIRRTVEANMLSVHTDCPTIERFAWQEPNHLMGAAILYMKDGKELWRKFLTDCRDAQHTASDRFRDFAGNEFCPGDGLVPSQAPCYIPNVLPVPGMGSFYDIIAWGSTIILGTRWHYLFYGDKSILEENYEAGLRYFRHLQTKLDENGFISHGLGDWGNPDGAYARENIETALLYADAITLVWFAEELGLAQDAAELRKEATQIRDHYNQELLVQDENGRWCYRSFEKRSEGLVLTQACEALPLYWNMVPEDKIPDVVDSLRQTLLEKDAFCAGEVGLPYIIQAAARYGMNKLIARFITKETHPSYYAFILDGETTLGEFWETNPRSHCHDMMGHITEWYYNGLAGITPLEPGFRKVRVSPWMPESMQEMTCTYEAPQGTIRVHGQRVNGETVFSVTLPQGIEKA